MTEAHPEFKFDYSADYGHDEDEECKETARFGGNAEAKISPYDLNISKKEDTIFDLSSIHKSSDLSSIHKSKCLMKLYKENSEFEHFSAGTVKQINYGVLENYEQIDILCQHLSTGYILLSIAEDQKVFQIS